VRHQRTRPSKPIPGNPSASNYIPSADPADIQEAVPYVVNALDAVLSGNPIPDAVTRAYGCTVKY
jgi:hypothetical protein